MLNDDAKDAVNRVMENLRIHMDTLTEMREGQDNATLYELMAIHTALSLSHSMLHNIVMRGID